MRWKTPQIEDIAMSSEIGSYQDDFGDDPRFIEKPTPTNGDAELLRSEMEE